MTTPLSSEILSASSDLWWEIDPDDWNKALQDSSHLTPPGIARQAALNRILLELLEPWLMEELDAAVCSWPQDNPPDSVWSVVSGTAFDTGMVRLVAIATESLEAEFRVPQEWVDIPTWVADYYLLLQVDVEGRIARLQGFSTHQRLKELGQYDPFDRTYWLSPDRVMEDINALFLARDFGLEPVTRAAIPPLPDVPSQQATNVLEQLASAEVYFPRLERPFHLWGACLSDARWRTRLYESRHNIAPRFAGQIANLADWFSDIPNVLASGWQSIADAPGSTAFSLRSTDIEAEAVTKEKVVRLAGVDYSLAVHLEPQAEGRTLIRASVKPSVSDTDLPVGFTFDIVNARNEIVQAGTPARAGQYRSEHTVTVGSGVVFGLRISIAAEQQEEWLQTP
ncbi:MAG: DUF1822 family protein [Synechococcus sp.]